MEIINTFEQENANLTIGAIGNSFGDDLFYVILLKEKIARFNDGNSTFMIEVANHGWNHEDFTRFDKEEQSALIKLTNEKIQNIFGVKPTVFIPPYNALNDNSMDALLENDIHFVSANVTSYLSLARSGYQKQSDSNFSGQAVANSGTILHFPSSVVTGDLNADNTEWLGYSHDVTFDSINASVNERGYAVVTMHPMEFSLRNGTIYQNRVDVQQIQELKLLIDDIRGAGFKIVTISQISGPDNATIPEFSNYSIYIILAVSIVIVIYLSREIKAISFSRNNNKNM
jgi:peptidoglycan/xylan/chitin deacetylase (PgdA/CDA1 family)